MNVPTRPALRWFGGKWRIARWIVEQFPQHRTYVEPFGGAASVLLRKPRSYAEVYNDLDDWVVNLFRVLRDDALAARLIAQLRLTPFARNEFEAAREIGEAVGDPVELARRLIIRSFMGFGSNAHNGRSTGFRANTSRWGTTPAQDWANYPDALLVIIERLHGVVIEHRDAIAVMAAHDGAQTLHYVDPPYVLDTRSPGNKYDLKYRGYRHDMDDTGHVRLIEELRRLEGYVVLSGYACPLYDERLGDWHRVTTTTHADGARPRTEVLWLNEACSQRLEIERRSDLFSSLPQTEATGPQYRETTGCSRRHRNKREVDLMGLTFADFKAGEPAQAMFRKLGLEQYLEAATSWRSLRRLIVEFNDPDQGRFVKLARRCDDVASSGERTLLHAILFVTDFAWLADELAEGGAWFRMDDASGDWREAVAACILQRENMHE